MKLSRSIKWTCCALGAIVLGVMTGPSLCLAQQRAGGAPAAALTNATHTRMQPEDAPGAAAVFGAQNAEGFYVYRTRFVDAAQAVPVFEAITQNA